MVVKYIISSVTTVKTQFNRLQINMLRRLRGGDGPSPRIDLWRRAAAYLFSGARVCDPQPLPYSKEARKRWPIWNFARCCGSQTRAPLNKYAVATPACFVLLALIAQNSLADAPLAPVIYSQPQSRTVPTGTLVTFKVDANGYPSLNYRWRRNGAT